MPLLKTLCARLSADTRITFTVNVAGAVEIAADDAFKLAAFLELGYVEMTNEACRRHPERDKENRTRRIRSADRAWQQRPTPCGGYRSKKA